MRDCTREGLGGGRGDGVWGGGEVKICLFLKLFEVCHCLSLKGPSSADRNAGQACSHL